jgi:hypothetical protein
MTKEQQVEQARQFVRMYGYRPSCRKWNNPKPNELVLGEFIKRVCSPASETYDPLLRKEFYSYPTWKQWKKQRKANDIMEFYDKYGFLPRQNSQNPYERKLAHTLNNITSQTMSHDEELTQIFSKMLRYKQWRKLNKKQKTIDTEI